MISEGSALGTGKMGGPKETSYSILLILNRIRIILTSIPNTNIVSEGSALGTGKMGGPLCLNSAAFPGPGRGGA